MYVHKLAIHSSQTLSMNDNDLLHKIVNRKSFAEEDFMIDCRFIPVLGAWLVYFILLQLTMANSVINWDTEQIYLDESAQ